MAIKVQGNIVIFDDETFRVAAGTTGERPTPQIGMLRFNTTENTFEGYDGTEWGPLGGGDAVDEYARTIALLGY